MKSVDEPFVAVQVFDIYIYGKNRSYFHRQMLSILCLCGDRYELKNSSTVWGTFTNKYLYINTSVITAHALRQNTL